jgi:predicted transcriptional regulator
MVTKTADSKGRVALGQRFANKTVIIEEIDETEVRIVAAVVIPEREMWLHRNEQAIAAVQRGLAQAKAGQLRKIDPHEDDSWLDKLDD